MRQYVPSATAHFEKEIINSARSYVDGPLHENLSLSTIAAKFYIRRYQVSRLFKQSFGVNYQEYVLSVRMNVASKYYLDGASVEDAIEEIKKNNLF